MTQEHWSEIKELLERALDLPGESRRDFILTSAAPEPVRAEAARLLEAIGDEDDFLEAPPQLAVDELLGAEAHPRFLQGDWLANRFRIERFLGRGGMGEVYSARDMRTGTPVALKTLRSGLAASQPLLDRLRHEMVLARAVTHRNVCRIFDLHQDTADDGSDVDFLSMERVEGETLSQYLEKRGTVLTGEEDTILKQVAAGLAAAHEAGIVHGDLKAANVMLTSGPESRLRAVVMDFGLAFAMSRAELEHDPVRGGTPDYMAPEQEQGPASTASDVYSFGVLAHEVLTGHRPVKAETGGLQRPWGPIVRRCLEADPARRYSDACGIIAALEPRPASRRAWAAAVAVLLVLAAVAAGMWFGPGGRSGTRAVAVLGFANASHVERAAYLSLLLSLALDEELAAAGTLRIVPAQEVARAHTELPPLGGRLRHEELKQLRGNLGADVIVHGSYQAEPTPGAVNVSIQVQDAVSGKEIATIHESGDERELPSLFARAGADVRSHLRLGPLASGRQEGARAALPGSLEAMRLYAEGMRSLRSFDALTAKGLLEQAVQVEPSYALAHSALAAAWASLGYDARAQQEAREALDLAGRLLPEDRLLIEGTYWEAVKQPVRAAQAYEALLRKAPKNPDYLLLLANVQRGREMLDTIARLRRLPAPVRDDPRIDLAEAQGAHTSNDYRLERTAALRAVERGRAAGAVVLTAQAQLYLGWASWILGEPQAARAAYTEARDLFTRAGDRNGGGRAIRGLGLMAQMEGDLEGAERLYNEALAVFQEIGSEGDAATTLNRMAMVASHRGRLSEALRRYSESLAICEEVKDPICIGTAENNLGYVLFKTGRLKDARQKLDAAMKAFEQAQGRYGRTFVLSSLGDVLAVQGRFAEAGKALEDSVELSRQLGDRASEASTLISLGTLRLYTGNLAEARAFADRALTILTALEERNETARARLLIAELDLREKKTSDAETQARQSVAEFQRSGKKDETAMAEALLANALAAEGRTGEALHATEEALKTLGNSENQLARVIVLTAVGRTQMLAGDGTRGTLSLDQAAREADRYGFRALTPAHRPEA